MKSKTLTTGIKITYENNGNIKTCTSDYDSQCTDKPLPKTK